MLNLGSLVESRMKEIEKEQERLLREPTISKIIESVGECVKTSQGRELDLHEKRVIAQCLWNAVDESASRTFGKTRALRAIFEATTEDAISFIGIQLPVIAALLPSLALNEVANVQALDRRIAAVFYKNIKYGTAKGAITSGTTMLGAKTGHAIGRSGRQFAMARVVHETLGTLTAGDMILTGQVQFPHLINRQNVKLLVVTNIGTITETETVLGSADEYGVVTGTYVVEGDISATGVYDITFEDLDSGTVVYITYDYQYDLITDIYGNRTGVPEADYIIEQEPITAIDYPIRSRYSVGAALDLKKAHGIDLEDEVVKDLGHEVKFSIDQTGLLMIEEAAGDTAGAIYPGGAAAGITSWDATRRDGEPWIWKKWEIQDRFEQGKNNIIEKTKRATATFILCGNNVARVISQLQPSFKRVGGAVKITGPVKIGDYDGLPVIQNPFMSRDKYVMGYKGDSYMDAGFLLCPYIPLFATPTLVTSDLMVQKGFLSSVGFKVVNAGMFCEGEIENLTEYSNMEYPGS